VGDCGCGGGTRMGMGNVFGSGPEVARGLYERLDQAWETFGERLLAAGGTWDWERVRRYYTAADRFDKRVAQLADGGWLAANVIDELLKRWTPEYERVATWYAEQEPLVIAPPIGDIVLDAQESLPGTGVVEGVQGITQPLLLLAGIGLVAWLNRR